MSEITARIRSRLEELERMDRSVLVKHLHRRNWPEELIKGKTLLWQVPERTGRLLYELVKAHQSRAILELGTSGGYSTLWMALALLGSDATIDTIEFSTYRFQIATESFRQTGTDSIITQYSGKTHPILKSWSKPVDFVFIDHSKENYLLDFKLIEPFLTENAVILADNILDNPEKVRDFTNYLKRNTKFHTHILTIDNGLLLAYKTGGSDSYETVRTADGSVTFRNTVLDETYHSSSGAFEEALEKHVRPSRLLEKAKRNDPISIADVCFGLGYNSLVALRELFRMGYDGHVELSAFENDTSLMKRSKELDFKEDVRNESDIIRSLLDRPYSYSDETIKARTLTGDVRETINTVAKDSFDVVFFDPFSPKKHPQLWSEELFRQVHRVMKRDAVLTTYSCARRVRDTLRAVGFDVIDGPRVGRRSPSTIAIKR